jgi:hypothetical protein
MRLFATRIPSSILNSHFQRSAVRKSVTSSRCWDRSEVRLVGAESLLSCQAFSSYDHHSKNGDSYRPLNFSHRSIVSVAIAGIPHQPVKSQPPTTIRSKVRDGLIILTFRADPLRARDGVLHKATKFNFLSPAVPRSAIRSAPWQFRGPTSYAPHWTGSCTSPPNNNFVGDSV